MKTKIKFEPKKDHVLLIKKGKNLEVVPHFSEELQKLFSGKR